MASDIDYARELERLIALWDKHGDRPWTVEPSRHGVNVAMINAYVSHSANLSRAVLALHREGLKFESVSLVRSTMESVMTAAWLAVFPEKTPALTLNSAAERKKVLDEVVDGGFSNGNPGLTQINALLEDASPIIVEPEAKWLKRRFHAIAGGQAQYTIYRVLCTWDHATNSLADAYTLAVEPSEQHPWGIVLLRTPDDPSSWVGVQAALLLRAQIAADMILVKPQHRTQLQNFARRFGVSETIEAAQLPLSNVAADETASN